MKKWLLLGLLPLGLPAFGQASVAYYPWADLFTVSTNPNRTLWLDARFQTNTLFGQLNTTLAPLINLKKTENYQFYTGPGVRFSAIDAAQGGDFLQGYSWQFGVRVAPLTALPQLQAAFEISPSVSSGFSSGVLYSRLGVAYVFRKKSEL
ncbi:hypothetical protein [Tellurirhabdus rosea]|uniref:hypothetical protein n=1 Tax=Tellurirhabdus rosea TaxID=2674997 RepID=UPI00225A0C6D|nr:hypothetical protein [Tellurirhabdus rosea]